MLGVYCGKNIDSTKIPTHSSLMRRESRGAHSRVDFPERADIAMHSRLRLGDALEAAQDLMPDPVI